MGASLEETDRTDGGRPERSVADRKQELRRRLERLIGIAATEGNCLQALRNGDEIFPAMLDAIRAAKHTVDMTTFVYWRGRIARDFAHALAAKAAEGVRVRLLLDGFGGRLIEQELLDGMDRAGVDVAWFRKPVRLSPFKQNHRCHRKVLVVDAEVAFTGGVGIAEEWCGDARHPANGVTPTSGSPAPPWTGWPRRSRRTGPSAGRAGSSTTATASVITSRAEARSCRSYGARRASDGRTCAPCSAW